MEALFRSTRIKHWTAGSFCLTLFGMGSVCFTTFYLNVLYEQYVFLNDVRGQYSALLAWIALGFYSFILVEFQIREMLHITKQRCVILMTVAFTCIALQFRGIYFAGCFVWGFAFCLLFVCFLFALSAIAGK